MSHSQAFSWTHMTKILGLILKKEKKENTHLREEGRAPGFFCKGKAQEQPPVSESLSCTALHWKHTIVNTLFASYTLPVKTRWYTGLSVVITPWVHTLHLTRSTHITGDVSTKEEGKAIREELQPQSSLPACERINV